MIKIVFIPFLLLIILGVSSAHSAKNCPAINCDCSSILNENWIKACATHEERIKKACVANSNTPKDYCSVHGPNARPLPLAIEFSEFNLDPSTDVDVLNEKVASLYWAIHADSLEAKEAFEEKSYARSMQILKLIDSNIDNLFEMQQKVSFVYLSRDDAGKAAGYWKKYAGDTNKYAKKIQALGMSIYDQYPSATSKKEKKIFGVLSQKALRMAGKGYEHSGYAGGQAEQHKKAARAWKSAAEIAGTLTEMNRALGAKAGAIKFSEFQAAARLHRASYHWMLNESTKTSVEVLNASKNLVDDDSQKDIENLMDSESKRAEEEGLKLFGR
ncbi:MAG: hypothetical protein K6L80_05725 [Agarilytica sp.]